MTSVSRDGRLEPFFVELPRDMDMASVGVCGGPGVYGVWSAEGWSNDVGTGVANGVGVATDGGELDVALGIVRDNLFGFGRFIPFDIGKDDGEAVRRRGCVAGMMNSGYELSMLLGDGESVEVDDGAKSDEKSLVETACAMGTVDVILALSTGEVGKLRVLEGIKGTPEISVPCGSTSQLDL